MRLLGGFEVSVGARVVDGSAWRLRKARSLVKLLALAPGHRLHREQLMDVLWPDAGPEVAVSNLHYALHVTRRALESTVPSGTPDKSGGSKAAPPYERAR